MSGTTKERYYRKKTELLIMVDKMKLWPSRSGVLHGVKSVERHGDYAIITTHCGETFTVRDSRHSRAARWLRNKWVTKPCPKCKIPEWKLEKYSKTFFSDKGGKTMK